VECTAHHPGSRGVADIVSVTVLLLSIEDLAVKGRNRSRLFVRERVELLIELFGSCERTNIDGVS